MPTGVRPWEEIAMDFIGELPTSDGFNAILVISKDATLYTRKDMEIGGYCNIYITDLWRQYGLPQSITSDRGPQFASTFREVCCHDEVS